MNKNEFYEIILGNYVKFISRASNHLPRCEGNALKEIDGASWLNVYSQYPLKRNV